MAEKNWRDLLAELKRDADELVAERTQFAHKHQETLQASLPRDEPREEALVRLRALAYEATISFGSHKGRSLQELAAEPEPNYLHWMLSKDFSPEVMQIVRDALNGEFPAPPDPVAEP